jgi:hypothetical protein
MSRIEVSVREDGVDSIVDGLNYLGRTTVLKFDELHTLTELEQVFLAVAYAAGFTYVDGVTFVLRSRISKVTKGVDDNDR